MAKILLVGEPMGLFIAQETGDLQEVEVFHRGVSGAELNVAIGLSRLDYQVTYLTKVGSDALGYSIKRLMEDEKIDTSGLIFDQDYNTGFQLKNQVAKGDPYVENYRSHSAFTTFTAEDIFDINFADYDLLHFTGIPLGISLATRNAIFYLVQKAREHKVMITFDPNIREHLWQDQKVMTEIINIMANLCNVFMPGRSEAEKLTGSDNLEEIAAFYFRLGVETVIIKDGGKGAWLIEPNQPVVLIPGFQAKEIIDTVGAGDGFATGIISGILDQTSKVEAVERGNAIGSIQIQHTSDNQGLPTRQELIDYIEVTPKVEG